MRYTSVYFVVQVFTHNTYDPFLPARSNHFNIHHWLDAEKVGTIQLDSVISVDWQGSSHHDKAAASLFHYYQKTAVVIVTIITWPMLRKGKLTLTLFNLLTSYCCDIESLAAIKNNITVYLIFRHPTPSTILKGYEVLLM